MKVAQEILFWLHLLLILAFFASAFLRPLFLVAALVIGHKIHLTLFDGCLFSHLQKRFGGLRHEEDFLQAAFKKLFKISITPQHSHLIDYSIAVLALSIAVFSA